MVLNLEASILGLLGGSWVVISRVISGVTILITHVRGLVAPLITTHEPPSIAITVYYTRSEAGTVLLRRTAL